MPRFQTRVREVEALPLQGDLAAKLQEREGSYLVIHGDGRHEILAAATFDETYERVSENGHSPPRQAGRQAGRPPSDRRALEPTSAARQNGQSKFAPGSAAAGKRIARPLWERGDPVNAIATAVGRSAATVYGWAAGEKWKRPDVQRAAPAVATPAGEKMPGRVRCPLCGRMTEYDPCEHCHKPVRKYAR